MAFTNYHPAPGLGDLLPGFYVLPQNPIRDAIPSPTGMVASLSAAYGGRPVQIRGTGDLIASAPFAVPQNPIRAALSGLNDLAYGTYVVPQNPMRPGISGLACAQCDRGLGGITDTVSQWINTDSPIPGVTNLVFYGALAGVGAYFFWFAPTAGKRRGGYHAATAPRTPTSATAANRRRTKR